MFFTKLVSTDLSFGNEQRGRVDLPLLQETNHLLLRCKSKEAKQINKCYKVFRI